MHESTQDAMTYVRKYGRPDLFITLTCDPTFPEITSHLFQDQRSHDRHDLIARVFNLKVKKLMSLLTKGRIFGSVRCYMYSIEWQKRGLPHAHVLLWLEERIKADGIDSVISAEIPSIDVDPALHHIVVNNMIHGPCGNANKSSPCMVDGKCSKRFPRPFRSATQSGDDGYPQYKRRSPDDGGFTGVVNRVKVDNRWVVPYNPVLLRTFSAHINVEYCSSVKSIKYICKYVNKGSDQAAFALQNEKDEISIYQTGRYISSSEAVWRILSFSIHERYPAVVQLAVHLENGQRVYFTAENVQNKLINPPLTTLMAFFQLCKTDDFAKSLLYPDVPSYYVWAKNTFRRRKQGQPVANHPGVKRDTVLGRVYTIHPNNTECYHVRLLLHHVVGPTSFTSLRTVNGFVHPTYQAACLALGLLENDRHWDQTLEEAAVSDSPRRMRDLFAVMLVFCQISDALSLWTKHRDSLSEDIMRQTLSDQPGCEEAAVKEFVLNECLLKLDDLVGSIGGQGVSGYGLPSPTRTVSVRVNRDYSREVNYDLNTLMSTVLRDELKLTSEQRAIYLEICTQVESGSGGVLFLDAPGGTGKTFLLNLLLTKVRSGKKIALAVASSGIAATLLEGGKTAHSAFKLPLSTRQSENVVCNISKQSGMGQLLRDVKLIVWDEATMAHKCNLEALNRSLQDIRNNTDLMGGVTVLLAGDFRQTLPVVQRGTRADEVNACLKSSVLWPHIRSLSLTKNMRVHLLGDKNAGEFSKLLLQIGDGKLPETDGQVNIPDQLCTVVSTLEELTTSVYPGIENLKDYGTDWLRERAILTPKNDTALEINNLLLGRFCAQEFEYKSVDTVVNIDEAVHYPVEFLNTLNPPGLPQHKLKVKVGAPVMLLRNLKPPQLCNGTRLQVTELRSNLIVATIFTGCGSGESVMIPRIPLIPADHPILFKRLQFPLKVAFAMTINKSQGQSLRMAGVDLRERCFSHGQFYVACSRVSSPHHLTVLADNKTTANPVYQEVLSSK